ncbi:SRPBCC family protein [Uliginosibacterium sp. H1]|uniref:SRPBCC family protein n=1 Tax=Uliginosibacterium sp. H1 TaxID=3114757 RepID=UPI002E17DBEC|nr:SRPBCC domain-containing protein [Uliginosibacterium sp. H1]
MNAPTKLPHFQLSLVLEASPATVYAALTRPEGLRGWWTEDCEADTAVGGMLRFRFGENHKAMRIEKLEAGREVQWLCTEAQIVSHGLKDPAEWVGTRMRFRLQPEGQGRTRLDFEHLGLTPALECYTLCQNGWNYFLNSLRQYVTTGSGTPHALSTECSGH